MVKNIVAAAVLLAFAGVSSAAVTASAGGNPGSFITLSAANVTGGALHLQSDVLSPNEWAIPDGQTAETTTVGTWLSSGPTGNANNGGGAAVVNLASYASSYFSFLWGSPDADTSFLNTLVITTTAGSYTFDAIGLGYNDGGNQQIARYTQFTADAGETILSASFSANVNAFEASNMSVTAVPEPETYALMLGGLGLVGFMARRRKAA